MININHIKNTESDGFVVALFSLSNIYYRTFVGFSQSVVHIDGKNYYSVRYSNLVNFHIESGNIVFSS
jgi:hypothetical protein